MTNTTVPTVTATTPVDGQGGVAVDGNATVTFDSVMDESTITASNIYVATAAAPTTALDATVSYDASTKTATIDPVSYLDASTQYVIHVDSAVTASNGVALAADKVVTFATSSAAKQAKLLKAVYKDNIATDTDTLTLIYDVPVTTATNIVTGNIGNYFDISGGSIVMNTILPTNTSAGLTKTIIVTLTDAGTTILPGTTTISNKALIIDANGNAASTAGVTVE